MAVNNKLAADASPCETPSLKGTLPLAGGGTIRTVNISAKAFAVYYL